VTARDVIQAALREIRVLGASDTASGDDATHALQKLLLLMEGWKVEGIDAYRTAGLSETLKLPDGAVPALVLTLAEELAPSFGVSINPMTVRNAGRARARYFASRRTTPSLETRDHGLPYGGAGHIDISTLS
jgi:hypothetical protein